MKKYVSIKNAQWSNPFDLHHAILLRNWAKNNSIIRYFCLVVILYAYVAIGLTIIFLKLAQYTIR